MRYQLLFPERWIMYSTWLVLSTGSRGAFCLFTKKCIVDPSCQGYLLPISPEMSIQHFHILILHHYAKFAEIDTIIAVAIYRPHNFFRLLLRNAD